MKRRMTATIATAVLVVAMTESTGQAQSADAALRAAISEFQQSATPAAAERVIRLAAAIEQPMPIPEEARRHFVRGTALFEEAKAPADVAAVVEEFSQAARIAPWWSEARFNLAVAEETAGRFTEAIGDLKLYLLFKLPAAEARSVQDRVYVIEAKAEKAAREAQAAQEQRAADDKRIRNEKAAAVAQQRSGSFEGKWIITRSESRGRLIPDDVDCHVTISKRGDNYYTNGLDGVADKAQWQLAGRELVASVTPDFSYLANYFDRTPPDVVRAAEGEVTFQCRLVLSADGRTANFERDECALNYRREGSVLRKAYRYVSTERLPGGVKIMLDRVADPKDTSSEIERALREVEQIIRGGS